MLGDEDQISSEAAIVKLTKTILITFLQNGQCD
jgi:hypothetical protein